MKCGERHFGGLRIAEAVAEAVADAGADRSPPNRQLCLSPAAACMPGHGSSLTDDFRFASVSCHRDWDKLPSQRGRARIQPRSPPPPPSYIKFHK